MNFLRVLTLTGQAVCSVSLSIGMVYVIAAQWTMEMSSEGRLIIFLMVALLWILIFWLRHQWVEWKEVAHETKQLLSKSIEELEQTTEDANDMMRISVLARHEAEFWREGIKDMIKELHEDGLIPDPIATIEELDLECSAWLTEVSEAMREEIEKKATAELDDETREALRNSIKKLFNRRRG